MSSGCRHTPSRPTSGLGQGVVDKAGCCFSHQDPGVYTEADSPEGSKGQGPGLHTLLSKSDQCLSSTQHAAGHHPFLVLDPAPWNKPLALGTGPSARPWELAITHHSLSQHQTLNRTLVCESGAQPQREETLFCAKFRPSGFSVHWLL